MNNLIAYMPVINRQYLDWLSKKHIFNLFLISQELAESLVPRLARNLVALSTEDVSYFLLKACKGIFPGSNTSIIQPEIGFPKLIKTQKENWIMPDEDVCHIFAERYLIPVGCQVEFESIWARWDMTAVKRQEPVIPDLEISSKEIDVIRMKMAQKLGQKSPDWWRQIGAMAWKDNELIACAVNAHYPTEYETFIFSDPRINFDAGDPAGSEIYLSLHGEKGIITGCARKGIPLQGASVYTTTFPCGDCAKMLADCQIKELFFDEGYSVLKGLENLKLAGVSIVKVNM